MQIFPLDGTTTIYCGSIVLLALYVDFSLKKTYKQTNLIADMSREFTVKIGTECCMAGLIAIRKAGIYGKNQAVR